MTFLEYQKSLGKAANAMRQGQLFLLWIGQHKGWAGKDPELFHCRDDQKAWNIINRKYGEYLHQLT